MIAIRIAMGYRWQYWVIVWDGDYDGEQLPVVPITYHGIDDMLARLALGHFVSIQIALCSSCALRNECQFHMPCREYTLAYASLVALSQD